MNSNKSSSRHLAVTPRFALRLLAVASLAALAGCAVTPPVALTQHDLLRQDQADRQLMFAAQEPVKGPLTLEEAVARTLKYNLQQRLALMERALEDDLVVVQNQGMLPRLTAQAGLRTRSNDYGSSSQSLRTGSESLEASTSQERNGDTASLQLSWNVLDFGLSYFGAKAQGNKALAAEERRRRVVADIVRQARSAYWTAVTAQRLRAEVSNALAETRQALDLSRQSQDKRLVTPLAALRYQRDLIGFVRQLEALDAELSVAKARLASLMNLAPGAEFSLAAVDDAKMQVPALPYQREQFESLAITGRAELREEAYQSRNALLETRMALLRLLPNASLFAGLNHDSNHFLVNNSWADAGVQVSWNLLNVLSWPAISRSAERREQVAELRRQALRMSVLTQVNIAWLERSRAEQVFVRAGELSSLQRDIHRQVENASRSRAETQLELTRARVEALLSARARDLAYADLLNAQGMLLQAAGIDPLPRQVGDHSVEGLASAIRRTDVVIASGALEIPRLPEATVTSVATAPAPAVVVPAPVAAVLPSPTLRQVSGERWHSLGSLAAGGGMADAR
ncbi:TolC family protein [Uliginosibacterium sp. TH139]|uniref:TolC family protein n=1 Tax=Uliginosibacterium sp. TH139 TaxID=2067453 RepID=UPI000C7C3E0C|nr:TolC family protein [Uliginosibacterium sp. TH139]PLK47689.1 TolC family protein [Uliginosibacterium sp. TH139]